MSEPDLPNEIMQNIFEEIASLDPQEARQTLYQSLFVSKNWSGFAKIESYENVCLPQDKIALFALNVSVSGLGYLVKNIEFYPVLSPHPRNYYTIPPGVEDALDTVLQNVPNLESISSSWIDFTGYILRRLQASEQQFKRLKSLPFSERMNLKERDLYASLALKFKGSLTKLSLIYDGTSDDFILLKTNLKDFHSLEHLRLCSSSACNSIIAEVYELIDNCHETAQILELQQCNLSGNHSPTGQQLNPNNSIKTLRLSDSILSASTIHYFANELAALETLVITARGRIAPPSQTKEEIFEWWNQMIGLCQRPGNYNLSIAGFNQDYLQQIKHWANLSHTIASRTSHQEGSAIEIDLNPLTNDEKALENSHIVRFKQHGSCVHLFESNRHASFTKIANIDQILECLHPFLPNVIRISNVEQELCSVFQRFGSGLNLLGCANYFIPKYDTESWAVFDGVVALTKDKPESVVHLDRMMLPELIYTVQDVYQLLRSNITELKFTNSRLHRHAFRQIASQLSQIDTLILDGCHIASTFTHRLEISLHGTTLGHLQLNLHRELSVGCYTVVVTTPTAKTTTYQYIKEEDCRNYRQVADTVGSEDNFLIFIECQELKSWAVTDINLDNSKTECKQWVLEDLKQ